MSTISSSEDSSVANDDTGHHLILPDIAPVFALDKNPEVRLFEPGTRNFLLNKLNRISSVTFESTPELAAFSLDFNYCYTAFNKNYKMLVLELSGKEIKVGASILDLFDEEWICLKEKIDRAFKGESFMVAEECCDENGKKSYWHYNYFPVLTNDSSIIGMSCFIMNITEFKTAEMALLQNEARQRAIITNISDVVTILDENGIIRFTSPNSKRLFGWQPGELEGKNYLELVHDNDKERLDKDFREFVNAGSESIMECMYKCGDGSYKTICMKAVNLISDRNIKGILINYHDITERKNAVNEMIKAKEEAEMADRSKSQFIANVSHEIRTPMNGIVGFLDLLSQSTLDSQQKDYLKEMKIASDSLLNLINDLLDISKIEANKLELENIPFNLRNIVEEAASLFSPRAYTKGVEIHAMVDNEIPVSIKGDPDKLRQVFRNLVSNAVKFTSKGEIVISAMLASNKGDKVSIHFKVSDTGIGISEDDSMRLFEPFTQVDASTTRKYGGTGLGLAICESIVKIMGGEIRVESIKGKGSTFEFTIPFDMAAQPQKNDADKPDLKGTKVLVTGGSKKNREIVRYYLENTGCLVLEADDLENAIDTLLGYSMVRDKIDVMLINHSSFSIKEFGRISSIKSNAGAGNTALILMESLTAPCNRELAAKAGISQYVTKPVYRSELIGSIIKALKPNVNEEAGKPAQYEETERNSCKTPHINARILLVEDNYTNQKLAANILKNAGFICDMAENGLAALHAVEKNNYDLVLMDCQMPEMDGYEATRRIREREAGKSHLAIIAMTANAMKSDYDYCIKAGMDDYISKPFKTDSLLKIIEKWLSKSNYGSDTGRLLEELAKEQQLDREVVYEIYNEFIEKFPCTLVRLRKAIDEGNFVQLAREAHSLKGASASLNLKELSRSAAELEYQSKAQDISLCRISINKIKEVYFRLLKG